MKTLQSVRRSLNDDGGDAKPHVKKLLSHIKCDHIGESSEPGFKTWWIDDRPTGLTEELSPPGSLCGPGECHYGLFDNLGMDIYSNFFNAHKSKEWQEKMDEMCPSKETLKACEDDPDSCEDSPASGKCTKATGVDPLVKHWSKIFVHHTFDDTAAPCVKPLSKILSGALSGRAALKAVSKCEAKIAGLIKMKKIDTCYKSKDPQNCDVKHDYKLGDTDDVNDVIDGLVEKWGEFEKSLNILSLNVADST
jgi:hypothetical protein